MNEDKINLDLNKLAPISVSVYDRISHFKKCVESLAANDLAKNSILYIFSDGAKPGDELSVNKVRKYAKSIKGFKKVKFFFQKKNNFYKNVINRTKIPFKEHNKVIRLEDDIVVSNSFLKYMNESLNKYEYHPNVFSVSGYLYPINFNFNKDYFFMNRYAGWGHGLWRKKWRIMVKNISSENLVLSYINNWYDYKKLYNQIPNMINSLPMLSEGKWKYSDYRYNLYFLKYNKFTLFPKKSLTKNIGHDGSGINCGKNNKYQLQKIYHGKINLNEEEIVKINLKAEAMVARSYWISRRYGSFLYFFYIKLKCKIPKLIKFLRKLKKNSDI